jgi:hypothetical protein
MAVVNPNSGIVVIEWTDIITDLRWLVSQSVERRLLRRGMVIIAHRAEMSSMRLVLSQ